MVFLLFIAKQKEKKEKNIFIKHGFHVFRWIVSLYCCCERASCHQDLQKKKQKRKMVREQVKSKSRRWEIGQIAPITNDVTFSIFFAPEHEQKSCVYTVPSIFCLWDSVNLMGTETDYMCSFNGSRKEDKKSMKTH